MSLKSSFIVGIIGALLLLATASSTYFWYKERNKPPVSRTEYITQEKIKVVEKIKKVEVPGPERIVTVEKKVIVEKVKMPDWFTQSADEQAIASAVIEAYKGKTNVISTLNIKTGVGQIVAKQEPLSFMGFENDKEIYTKIGYSTAKETQVTVGGRWLFGRVGGIKAGIYGEGRLGFDETRTSGEASAGIIFTY